MPSKARKAAAQASYQQGQRKNMIYNGDMTICQRSTSVSGIGNGDAGYHVQDRWRVGEGGAPNAVVTMSKSTTAPDGFASSLKLDCTTASGTVADADLLVVSQLFEGQDLQSWNKGDAQARAITISFWVNTTKTGTYIISMYDNDNNRACGQSYTVSSSDTWEYKTVTFPPDTTGAYDNDNAVSLYLYWGLVAGADYAGGSLATAWESNNNPDRFTGQVDAFDSTSNNFHLTGVQMELGNTATDFQYESHTENLTRCQRYYEDFPLGSYTSTGNSYATNAFVGCQFPFRVTKRATPTLGHPTIGTSSGNVSLTAATGSWVTTQPNDLLSASSVAQGLIYITASESAAGLTDDSIMAIYQSGTGSFTFDSEL